MGMNMNKKIVYEQFKTQFLQAFEGSGNYDANKIKAEFRTSITARRRYERIRSLSDLLDVLEKQLVIFPDRGVLEPYKVIALSLDPPRHQLAALVDSTKAHLGPRMPVASAAPRVPNNLDQDIIHKIAKTFDDAGGRDWENLATGLGYKLKNADRDKIRIRQGEVDRIDRNCSTMDQKLRAVFSEFIDRCRKNNVYPNMVEHVCDILKSKEVSF